MRMYLDVCCLNRPFDDQSQFRIRLETEAVIIILSRALSGEWRWLGSSAVTAEIRRTPDVKRRGEMLLLEQVDEKVVIDQGVIERMQELAQVAFKSFDGMHLACAERGAADVFLTTDDRLLRTAERLGSGLSVRVVNPLDWLQEVIR
jgi:predicted nucleic acid-binding protein